jgi:hypothetical protein
MAGKPRVDLPLRLGSLWQWIFVFVRLNPKDYELSAVSRTCQSAIIKRAVVNLAGQHRESSA